MRRRILYSVALAAALSAVALSSSVLPGAAEPTTSGTPGSAPSRPAMPQRPSTYGTFDVWAMRADGSDQLRLTHSGPSTWAWQPAWSPDGGKIAYANSVAGGSDDIFVMNADGSDPTDITNAPATAEAGPNWSPDGRKIAFMSRSSSGSFAICVINADGTDWRTLTSSSWGDFDPSWSPDGRKIAFYRYVSRDSSNEIFVVNADGSGLTQLTHGWGYNESPAWSPDGRRIAFNHIDYVFGPGMYVMNADGTHWAQLASGYALGPAWSPDGKRIAFSRYAVPFPSTYPYGNSDAHPLVSPMSLGSPSGFEDTDIYVMKADGSGQTRRTSTPDADGLGPQSWSPDGSHLTFTRVDLR